MTDDCAVIRRPGLRLGSTISQIEISEHRAWHMFPVSRCGT
jgi:hypothetical protein